MCSLLTAKDKQNRRSRNLEIWHYDRIRVVVDIVGTWLFSDNIYDFLSRIAHQYSAECCPPIQPVWCNSNPNVVTCRLALTIRSVMIRSSEYRRSFCAVPLRCCLLAELPDKSLCCSLNRKRKKSI